MSDVFDEVLEVSRSLRGLLEWQRHTGIDRVSTTALSVPSGPAAGPLPAATVDPAELAAAAPSPVAPGTTPEPGPALAHLQSEVIGDCRRCKLCDTRRNIVFGVGNPNARLMFVGEGPGANEDRQGEPFVGRGGQLLDRIIAAMGLQRADVYIANIVKCRPPNNRDPEADEVQACEPFLKEQIRIIRPEVLVALGRVAATTLLQRTDSLSRLRRTWHDYEGIPLLATYHPAFLLRSPDMKRRCWEDIQLAMERLGLPVPAR